MPIERGFHWVLTYNLVRDNSGEAGLESIPVFPNLEVAVRQWSSQEVGDRCFVFLLDHQYTEVETKISLLKGNDLPKAIALRDVCKPTDTFFFLASVTTHKVFDEDKTPCWTGEEWSTINMLYEEDGQTLSGTYDVSQSSIVQRSTFDEWDPDEEYPMAYSRGPVDFRYHSTVCIAL